MFYAMFEVYLEWLAGQALSYACRFPYSGFEVR